MVWIATEINVSLDDFDNQDLVEHLEKNGYTCFETGSTKSTESISGSELERIDHLLVCGQKQAAIEEIFSVVGHAIGRQIAH